MGCRASDVVCNVIAALSCTKSDKARKLLSLPSQGQAVISVPAEDTGPAFDIIAVIEPLSRSAQKILPIVLVSNGNCLSWETMGSF